jgi:hypothetical protein
MSFQEDNYIVSVNPVLALKYSKILESKKPDAEVEFFWLTFKDSIINTLESKEKEELLELSEKLNSLQIKLQYAQIERFISNHLDKISWKHVMNKNGYDGGHILCNLKRWRKISKTELPYKSASYAGLRTMIHYKEKYDSMFYSSDKDKHKDKLYIYDNVLELLSEIGYAFLHEQSKINNNIHNLMNYAIKNSLESVIHHFSYIIDIQPYLNDETPQHMKMNIINKLSKPRKLMKYLEIKEKIPSLFYV